MSDYFQVTQLERRSVAIEPKGYVLNSLYSPVIIAIVLVRLLTLRDLWGMTSFTKQPLKQDSKLGPRLAIVVSFLALEEVTGNLRSIWQGVGIARGSRTPMRVLCAMRPGASLVPYLSSLIGTESKDCSRSHSLL